MQNFERDLHLADVMEETGKFQNALFEFVHTEGLRQSPRAAAHATAMPERMFVHVFDTLENIACNIQRPFGYIVPGH